MNDESEERKHTPLEIDAITAKTMRELKRDAQTHMEMAWKGQVWDENTKTWVKADWLVE